MPKVRCSIPNASTNIDGYAFKRVALSPTEAVMESVEDLPEDVVAHLLSIPGFEAVKPGPFRPPQQPAQPPDQETVRADIDTALAHLPDGVASGQYKDPEYVVNSMRAHFGPTFSADDEAAVRKTFSSYKPLKPPALELPADANKAVGETAPNPPTTEPAKRSADPSKK